MQPVRIDVEGFESDQELFPVEVTISDSVFDHDSEDYEMRVQDDWILDRLTVLWDNRF